MTGRQSVKISARARPEHWGKTSFRNDPYPKKMGNITVLPWRDGIKKYFC